MVVARIQIDCLLGNTIEFIPLGETHRYLTDRTRFHYTDTILEITRSLRAKGTHTCEHVFGHGDFPPLTKDQPGEWWDRLAGEAELVARSLADLTFDTASSVAQELVMYVAANHLHKQMEEDLLVEEWWDQTTPARLPSQEHDFLFADMLDELVVSPDVSLLFRPQAGRRLPEIYYTPEDWFVHRLHDL